jgi:ribosomal protein S18 acetylase RimI-like enzyme
MSLTCPAFQIRVARFPEDTPGILAIERSYTTDRFLRIERGPNALELVEQSVDPPFRKAFPLDDVDEREAFVAESAGQIVGFAAYAHQKWNRRTELCHLYVSPNCRRSGVGRALVDAVVSAAREAGTRCVWLETSTHAWPAIQFYRRLGFELCGLDASLYDPDGPSGSEVALFFALPFDSRKTGE